MLAEEGPEALGRRIDAGDHTGDGSSNKMVGATADHIMATSKALDVGAELPGVVQELFRTACRDGWAQEDRTRLVDILRGGATRAEKQP